MKPQIDICKTCKCKSSPVFKRQKCCGQVWKTEYRKELFMAEMWIWVNDKFIPKPFNTNVLHTCSRCVAILNWKLFNTKCIKVTIVQIHITHSCNIDAGIINSFVFLFFFSFFSLLK